jgi:aminopeptidase N
MEIRNFYTMTVYEKGAEVVRMIRTLIGAAAFRKGMDLYFARHDGQAVTCDDFLQAMADASGADLSQFKLWYDQAGTPVLDVASKYDPARRRCTITVKQSCPPRRDRTASFPSTFRWRSGWWVRGRELLAEGTKVLSLRRPEERFEFENLEAGTGSPVPSLARDFSAPVIVKYDYTDAELALLAAHDADPFNRWEAGQRLALRMILDGVEAVRSGSRYGLATTFVAAIERVLVDAPRDPAFAAEMLALPAESYIAEQMTIVDPDAIHAVRDEIRRRLALALKADLLGIYRDYTVRGPYSPDTRSAGRRALRNAALGFLMELDEPGVRALCARQLETADNMTDALAALARLANCDCPERLPALEAFYGKWKDEPLVVDKWLALQSGSRLPAALSDTRRLMAHPALNLRNPNKVYALIGRVPRQSGCASLADGLGYASSPIRSFPCDQPAGRRAHGADRWRNSTGRQAARARRERDRDAKGVSKGVLEIASRALAVGVATAALHLGELGQLPGPDRDQHVHRGALLERAPRVVAVQVGELVRDPPQAHQHRFPGGFREPAGHEQHQLVGAVKARAEVFVLRLSLE